MISPRKVWTSAPSAKEAPCKTSVRCKLESAWTVSLFFQQDQMFWRAICWYLIKKKPEKPLLSIRHKDCSHSAGSCSPSGHRAFAPDLPRHSCPDPTSCFKSLLLSRWWHRSSSPTPALSSHFIPSPCVQQD